MSIATVIASCLFAAVSDDVIALVWMCFRIVVLGFAQSRQFRLCAVEICTLRRRKCAATLCEISPRISTSLPLAFGMSIRAHLYSRARESPFLALCRQRSVTTTTTSLSPAAPTPSALLHIVQFLCSLAVLLVLLRSLLLLGLAVRVCRIITFRHSSRPCQAWGFAVSWCIVKISTGTDQKRKAL